MGAFILVILITMGSGEDLKSFEIRMNKDSQSECLKAAKTYQLQGDANRVLVQFQ